MRPPRMFLTFWKTVESQKPLRVTPRASCFFFASYLIGRREQISNEKSLKLEKRLNQMVFASYPM